MKKINIIRHHAKGDVFLVEPILRQLSSHYKVNLTTDHDGLFNTLSSFSINKDDEYDIEIDLNMAYENKPKQHILTSYIEVVQSHLNESITFESPAIIFDKDELNSINALKKHKYAIINIDPAAYYPNSRRVFGLDILTLGNEIKSTHNMNVYEVGVHNQHGLPRMTIENERDLMVFIEASTLFIGLDSFCLHIAASLNKPQVCFFGGINPKYRLCEDSNRVIIQKRCEKQHCYHNHIHVGDSINCDLNLDKPKCAITTNQEVMAAIKSLNIG